MYPVLSGVNFSPSSTERSGPPSTTAGTTAFDHRLQGHAGDVWAEPAPERKRKAVNVPTASRRYLTRNHTARPSPVDEPSFLGLIPWKSAGRRRKSLRRRGLLSP